MSPQPRILVVRGGAIGDFILTLPAIAALRARWPTAHLEILGYPHIIELAHGRGYADAVRSIEARAMAGFFVPRGILDPDWWEYFGSFGLVVSYLFDPDAVFADNIRRCGAKQVIEASPRPTDLPAAVHYCRPLEQLAIYVRDPRVRLFPSEADRLFASGYLDLPSAVSPVALHVGSGSARKNWPVEGFADLARWLVVDRQQHLLVIAGEADTEVIQRFDQRMQGVSYRRVSDLSLVQLAAMLEHCRLFVGNDSGITHLAAAVQTPTIALFGPASRPIWEPVGDHVRVVPFGASAAAEVRRRAGEWLGPSAC